MTGGTGSTTDGEISEDYDLPNDMACTETCASMLYGIFASGYA